MIDIKEKQIRLFLGCQYARLCIALDIVKKEIAQNMDVPVCQNDSWLRQLTTAASNSIKNYKSEGLYKKKAIIEHQITDFKSKHSSELYPCTYTEIQGLIKEIYNDDAYSLGKIVFSASIVFDNEYVYEYNEKCLRNLSREIWNDEFALGKIYSEIEKIYLDLEKQPFSTTQKILLGGTIVLALATLAAPALLNLGNGNGSAITHGLASYGTQLGLGGTMMKGVGLLLHTETLINCIMVGAVYAGMTLYNKNEVKKSFRSMSYNSLAHVLAVKCYLMQIAKKVMSSSDYKESVNELLQVVQDLKSDTDYLLFIEKANVEDNKAKLRVFHNLDKKLMEILSV